MRSDCAQNHSKSVSPDDIPWDHWYSISFQFCPLFGNPASESSLLGHFKLFSTRVLSLLLLSMTIIVSILFFEKKELKKKKRSPNGAFLYYWIVPTLQSYLSGRASDISWWGRLPCICICLVIVYQQVENNKKKWQKKSVISYLFSSQKYPGIFSQNDVV